LAESRFSVKVIPTLRKDLLLASLKRGERLDGRGLHDYRSIKLQYNIVSKAEGSALAQLGSTKVVAGLKTVLSAPFPDAPDQGVLIVNAELTPLASPLFEPGPPGEEDIELARIVDRGIRSAPAIDFGKLSIMPGSKVWGLFIDIYPLDYDGNLVDAAGLAAMAALLSGKIPKAVVEDNKVVVLEEKENVPVLNKVVFVTIAKVGEYLLVDPSLEEELLADARITFSFTERGEICAIQKMGAGSFTVKEILEAQELAEKASKHLFQVLSQIV
jgi:exosome complex component RRP42